jgi:RNA polymerase sigma-70 factor (ECF subfamily)
MSVVTSGHDRAEVAAAFDRHRRELHVHCYRMTGSFTDAEDLTQETFLRAWRGIDGFEGRASLRSWLYHIATNACLDFLKRHERRTIPVGVFADPLDALDHDARLQPYPDHPDHLGQLDGPGAALARKETTELVLVAALAGLPPRQRAALVSRDLLEHSAGETAALLGVSVASANSLVQRARAALRRRAPGLAEEQGQTRPSVASAGDDDLLRRYVDAHERGDADAVIALLREDVRITMPPEAPCTGSAAAAAFFRSVLGAEGPGDWRLVPTRANGRPATANYLRRPGDGDHRALSIDVLIVADDRLVAVHCFLGDRLFPAFGLPLRC